VWAVWMPVWFGNDQTAYGGWDVLFRVGSRGGGLGVEEAVEGVRGGWGVEGMLVFTSYSFIAGSLDRQVRVTTRPWHRLYSPGCISASELACLGFHGWRRTSYLAPSGPAEGLHLCVASIAWHVAHKRKPSHSRHLIFCGSFVRFGFAERLSQPIIYLSHVLLLVLFGH
jgi:hypothetical protein